MAKKRSVPVEETENNARAEIRQLLLASARDGEWGPPGSAVSDLSVVGADEANELFSTLNEGFKKYPRLFGGSPYHDNETFRVIAAHKLECSVPPSSWRDYILNVLRHTRPVLPTAQKLAWRNFVIRLAVEFGREAGLDPTRSCHQRYTNGAHSACSLVAEELKKAGLHLSEDAVEKVWRRVGKN